MGRVTLSQCLLLALVSVCSRAQDFDIAIPIGSNNRSTAILPNEVGTINVTSANPIIVDRFESDLLNTPTSSCDGEFCIVNLTSLNPSSDLQLTIFFNTTGSHDQTLTLTIRERLNASCARYYVARPFSPGTDPYVFTCDPMTNEVEVADIEQVLWRRFRNETELQTFLLSGSGFEGNRIYEGGIFDLRGDKNQTLSIANADSASADDYAYYYVPSFQISGGNELLTGETIIFDGPEIRKDEPEFSLEVILETDEATFYNEIRCEANSFPPASVSWTLTSEEYPNGTNVADLSQFQLVDSGEGLTLTRDSIVQMRNLRYEDDGTFMCSVDNGGAISTRVFRLRVKSNLRPLWPFLGTLGVFILVSLSMCCHAIVDRLVARRKPHGYRTPESASPNHTESDGHRLSSVSSSSGQPASDKKHGAVKRISSARPLIEEQTL